MPEVPNEFLSIAIGGLDPHLGLQREQLDVAVRLSLHELVVIGAS
jgi:hypothetical protein